MTRSLQTDRIATLTQTRNALLLGGPDNKLADRIAAFQSGEARWACVSTAQSNCSSLTAIEADATTLLLLAQCVS